MSYNNSNNKNKELEEIEKQKATKKGTSPFKMMKNQKKISRARETMNIINGGIGIVIVGALVWFLMSGQVNQRELLTTIVQKGKDGAVIIAEKIKSLTTEDSPIEINKDGVYIKDGDGK